MTKIPVICRTGKQARVHRSAIHKSLDHRIDYGPSPLRLSPQGFDLAEAFSAEEDAAWARTRERVQQAEAEARRATHEKEWAEREAFYRSRVESLRKVTRKEDAPEGYILLKHGQTIKKGDKFFSKLHQQWRDCDFSIDARVESSVRIARPNPFTGTKSAPQPPPPRPGYFNLIDPNTVVQEGDLYWTPRINAWGRVRNSVGKTVKKARPNFFCRPIPKASQPKAPSDATLAFEQTHILQLWGWRGPDVLPGYRILGPNEIIRRGDLVAWNNPRAPWVLSKRIGSPATRHGTRERLFRVYLRLVSEVIPLGCAGSSVGTSFQPEDNDGCRGPHYTPPVAPASYPKEVTKALEAFDHVSRVQERRRAEARQALVLDLIKEGSAK